MLVLGAGPGGYSAAFRAADLGMKTVLIERYPTLGGVCLNVGCIPSKALLHIAGVMDEVAALGEHGIGFGAPKVDLPKLLAWKNKVVGKLTGGLTGMAKSRKVEVVRGYGMFVDAHHVAVELTDGSGQNRTGAKKVVRFQKAIIAAGSQSVRPALRAGRSAHRRFDRRPGAQVGAEANAGRRWRHHRAGDGNGVFDPRRAARRGRDARWPDARRRPRPGACVGQDEQASLRSHHAKDQDGRHRSEEGCDLRPFRG